MNQTFLYLHIKDRSNFYSVLLHLIKVHIKYMIVILRHTSFNADFLEKKVSFQFYFVNKCYLL